MEALDLRRTGATYRLISHTLGISLGSAFDLVRASIARIEKECAEEASEMRRLENERLDRLQLAVWQSAIGGRVRTADGREVDIEPNLAALDRVLAIMHRRARLNGLEAATRQEWSGPHGGPIPMPQPFSLRDLSENELSQLETLLAKAGGVLVMPIESDSQCRQQPTHLDKGGN